VDRRVHPDIAYCLYEIYFIDIQVYVAVTWVEFPVWLQDGKWPPEGKLSSSSISPRGFSDSRAALTRAAANLNRDIPVPWRLDC
jgi:hypothetical protein